MANSVARRLLLPYQEKLVNCDARFTWNNWSRQTGKSHALALRRIMRGIARKKDQIFLSAGERQSRELMMKAQKHVKALKLISEFKEMSLFEKTSFKQLEIVIPSAGIRIIGLPANPDTTRGFTGDVFLDEFAMHQHDREIWGSVFPTVLRGNGELDIASTPKGRQNMFYVLRDNDEFEHSTVTIDDAIADGLAVDREAIRKAMGDDELFRQEFLCEFVDEASAFLTFDMIGECERDDLAYELDIAALREKRIARVIGVDIGRRKDLTVAWVFEVRGRELISAGMLEMCNVPFAEQQERVANVIMASGARRVAIDASPIGSEFAERMQLRFGDYTVEACAFSAPFKEQIAGRMRNRFIDRTIRIPRHEKVRNDLHSVRKTVTAAGNIRLNAPREEGSHADRFWACALACHAAAEDTGPIEICCPEPVGRMQTRDPYRDEQEQGINRGKSDYVPW